ncbi:hypothetical protein AZZ65_001649, partial [Escherichia coli]
TTANKEKYFLLLEYFLFELICSTFISHFA